VAGTNAYAAKAALLTALQGEQGSGEGLENVNLSWSYVGALDGSDDEYVWLGNQWTGPVSLAAMKGGTASRIRREETISGSVHVKVRRKGERTTQTAEERAVAIGTTVEHVIALDPTLASLAGLLKATVEQVELQSYVDDDGATTELTYTIAFQSHVR
jgi:hypothetical protein